MDKNEHSLSWKALMRIVSLAFVLFLIWKAVGVFVAILIAIIFSTALWPLVKKFDRKLPRFLSILLVLLLILAPFSALIYLFLNDVANELPSLTHAINSAVNNSPFITSLVGKINIGDYIQNLSGGILESTKTVALTVTSALTVVFMVFYFLFDFEELSALFLNFFREEERPKIKGVLEEMALVTGIYIRGNLLISLISGSAIYLGLTLLHIPFAFPLAIFTAIMDLLPLVGSTIGSVPAIILGFTISPAKGIYVMLLYFLYQQSENAFIAPVIYNKALNISSSLTFIAVVIGGSVFGILGAFLALPLAASIPAIIRYRENYIKHQGN